GRRAEPRGGEDRVRLPGRRGERRGAKEPRGPGRLFEKSGKIRCDGLKADIFNSKGALTTEIFADKGNIDKNDKLVIFTGNVRIKTFESKSTIFTEELYLDYKNNKLFSNVPVSIKKDDGSYLNASSMESDIKTEESSFQNMEIKYFYEADDEGKNVKKKK
ncbi:MAG TPA: LPS export ABC transporter periplasmic protein LptC, partial [Spirochaetota bacterium]|nr:LPS export ABC transporter periplasmic protein LptC [Spirochaetota bacterium]